MNTTAVAPSPVLSSHDKATLAIDAIENELPNRSTLPFEFLELAVIALQKSTDDARAAVRQRNKTINELRALCNSLEERLRAISMSPPTAPPAASSPGSAAVHPAESLHKPPKASVPQASTQAATSADKSSPTPPAAPPVVLSGASAGIGPLPIAPTPPTALPACPSGAVAGSVTVSPLRNHCGVESRMLQAQIPSPPAMSTGNLPTTTFRGRRGTKPSELHIQFKSRAEFNTKLMRFFDNNIISHRHSLLDALVSAVCTRINEESSPLFSGNRLHAAFWTPRGNLLIRFLKAPSPSLLAFMLDTLEMVCVVQCADTYSEWLSHRP
ncbi:hypothetical protein AX14_010201 [Amanita brunnescens Koide BX004]|nr:hypothetical protein AX14_010201 [Amanita brunnescens Koide BX004]